GDHDRVGAVLSQLHVGQRESRTGLSGQIHAVVLPLIGDGQRAEGGDAQGDVGAVGSVRTLGLTGDYDVVHDLNQRRGSGDDFECVADGDAVGAAVVGGDVAEGEGRAGGAGEIGAVELPLVSRGDIECVGEAQDETAARK